MGRALRIIGKLLKIISDYIKYTYIEKRVFLRLKNS